MRRRRQGQFATFAMLIPMFAIPVMAVFGIPQFAPVVASPADQAQPDWLADQSFDRVGQSDAFPMRSLNLIADESEQLDLFQPYSPAGNSVVRNLAAAERWPDSQVPSTAGRPVSVPADAVAATPVLDLFEPVGDAQRPSPETASRDEKSQTARGRRTATQSAAAQQFRSASRPAPSAQNGTSSTRIARQPVGSSWRDAINRLNQLGIRTYRLSPSASDGRYHFMCLVTSADDPRISRRFEAESREPLDAVDRVLAQVEEWNRIR